MRPTVLLLASAFVGCGTTAATVPARGAVDREELTLMRSRSPHAAELFERADALAAAGALADASALFREAHDEYPESSLLWRRDCETRTAMGRRSEAIVACAEALERGHSDLAVRALVSAFVDGPTRPTTTDVYQAWLITEKARNNPLGQATAAAATCDIAESIGDGAMLQRCGEELARIAPNDPATEKAMAALSSRCPPWRFWTGWGALLAVVFVTLADALRRLMPRAARRVGAAAGAATLLSAVILLAPAPAHADESPKPKAGSLSKWPVDVAHPEDGIPSEKDRNADPLQFGYWLQDVSTKAERASKDGDHLNAERLYGSLARAVPDRAVAFVKMCDEYEALGELAKAANACGDALLRDGARVTDYSHFVRLMLTKPGELRDKDIAALAAVLEHMKGDPEGRDAATDLECQVGARTSNVKQLRECTSELAARAPDDPKTLSYLWALAVAEGRFDDARKLGERAKAAGIPVANVAAMDRATASSEAGYRRTLVSSVAGAVLLAAAGLLGLLLLRRRTATKAALLHPGAPGGASV